MGYTHYYYIEKEFDKEQFGKVATDFKKMVTPLKHLGVVLADGSGENHPTISPTEIRFNGLEKCGHTKRDLGITWPSKNASGISKNSVTQQLEELVNGSWFAGAKLSTRVCGGDCSHETFSLSQKLETTLTRYDGSKYELEPQGEFVGYQNQDGTRNKNPENEVEKYFACTKTAYKPYDLAVTVCLVIAKHHLGEQIVIHSDGEMDHWHEAMQLCHHFLGYGKGFSLDDDESIPLDVTDPHAMIAQCNKNKKEITSLKESQEKLEDKKREEISKINERYRETIYDLQKQQRIETEKLEEKIESASKENNQKMDELSKAESALNRTIYFLRQQTEKLDYTALDEIKNYHEKHLEVIETYQDDCLSLRLYIAENDRPKNKYSVIVAGKSKLGGDDILELPYSYGVHLNTHGLSILSEIRHFATIEDAKKYHEKYNLQKLFKEFFVRYSDVKTEYEQTCKKYSLDDFAELLHQRFVAYWERTSSNNKEIVTKELGLNTTDIKKMSEKQISLLMQEERHCY